MRDLTAIRTRWLRRPFADSEFPTTSTALLLSYANATE